MNSSDYSQRSKKRTRRHKQTKKTQSDTQKPQSKQTQPKTTKKPLDTTTQPDTSQQHTKEQNKREPIDASADPKQWKLSKPKIPKHANNYAFIDAQNVNLSIQNQWWKLDRRKLFVYLKEKYKVKKTYMFIGFVPTNQEMYNFFQSIGYTLIFKPVLELEGKTKGNVDAELVLQAMIDLAEYDQAVIVTWDGDFGCLVDYLYRQEKLARLIVPNARQYSIFLKQTAKERLDSLSSLKRKLGFFG